MSFVLSPKTQFYNFLQLCSSTELSQEHKNEFLTKLRLPYCLLVIWSTCHNRHFLSWGLLSALGTSKSWSESLFSVSVGKQRWVQNLVPAKTSPRLITLPNVVISSRTSPEGEQYKVTHSEMRLVYFYITALLRYDWHNLKFTPLKDTVQ